MRLVRDLRGLYVCVWRKMCLESSNYLLFFLYRIVFVFILISLLKWMPRVGGHCVACETLPPVPVLCLPSFTRRLPSYTTTHTEPLSSRSSARTTTTTIFNPKKTMAAASAQGARVSKASKESPRLGRTTKRSPPRRWQRF